LKGCRIQRVIHPESLTAAQKNTKSSVLSALGVVAARGGNWKDDLF